MEIQTSLTLSQVCCKGDTLAASLFIICLDYELRTLIVLIKENGLALEKAKSRRYSARIITDVDYNDDKALLANIPVRAESIQHRLEQAA